MSWTIKQHKRGNNTSETAANLRRQAIDIKLLTFKPNIKMKRKLKFNHYILAFVSLLLCAVFLSCEDGQIKESIKVDSDHKTDYTTYGATVRVIVIDSCEYLYSYNFNATWCTHKGNCKFCAERAKRPLK